VGRSSAMLHRKKGDRQIRKKTKEALKPFLPPPLWLLVEVR
jgi:hypothetical protein